MDGIATGSAQAFEPRYIRLDLHDNVAIVVNDAACRPKRAFHAASN